MIYKLGIHLLLLTVCRVYVIERWNTFISDEFTMSSGSKNMIEESRDVFYYPIQANDNDLGH